MGLFDGFKKRKKDYKEVAADNTKLSERDMLINKIGSDKIQYICDMYMIKKDNLSIDFLTKLASSEEIINFLTQNFLTSESVQKMNNNNFSLKYYSNDVLYSVLSGDGDNGKYIYNYQVIDKVYNLKISIKNINNNYSFLLESNIDNNIDNILIDGTFVNEGSIEEDVNDAIKYNNLTDIQKNIFNSGIKQMLFS